MSSSKCFGNANLSFRYMRRNMPQILEDIGQLSIAGYILAPDTPVDYFITNVNANTEVVQCCGFTNVAFEDPAHTYNAFEVTLNKRFSNNWGAIASYRFSKLDGNFEGFFRSDNGQSDPAISSLFDFPTNDPSYTALSSQHGGLGDIRYQGTSLGSGVLPNDRPHQLKLYGNYAWNAFNLGLGFNAGSGRSLTALASNPIYANAGEIPMTIRGEGMKTVDGFKERTPMEVQLDLHGDYALNFGGRRVTLASDVFNLFNRRSPTDYDNWVETTTGTNNPNFGYAANGGGSVDILLPGAALGAFLRALRLVIERNAAAAFGGGGARQEGTEQSVPFCFEAALDGTTMSMMCNCFNRSRPLGCLVVAGWLVAATASAQQPQLTFPARVEAVSVDVVVVDKQGRPVEGLVRADFTIREDGTPQNVAAFEAISLTTPGVPQRRQRVSDNATRVEDDARWFFVAFDNANISQFSTPRARDLLQQLFAKVLRPGDHVMVAATAGGASWTGTLPDDLEALQTFVAQLQGLRRPDTTAAHIWDHEAIGIASGRDPQAFAQVARRYFENKLIPESYRSIAKYGRPFRYPRGWP